MTDTVLTDNPEDVQATDSLLIPRATYSEMVRAWNALASSIRQSEAAARLGDKAMYQSQIGQVIADCERLLAASRLMREQIGSPLQQLLVDEAQLDA